MTRPTSFEDSEGTSAAKRKDAKIHLLHFATTTASQKSAVKKETAERPSRDATDDVDELWDNVPI